MTTPIADMVDAMVEKGATATAIAVAVRALEVSASVCGQSADSLRTNADKRRERDRLAKQEKRAKYRELKQQASPCAAAANADTSADSLRTNADKAPLSILSSVADSQGLPKEESKEEVLSIEPRAKPKRGSRLPDDWEPSEVDRRYAAGRGLRLVEIEIEATKFRNYWTNRTDKQAAKPRWDRAWQNWILNVRAGSQSGAAPRPGSKDDTRERTVNALRSLDPFPYADDAGRGQGTGPPIPRRLSFVKSP